MSIVTIIGTRPQLIKSQLVSESLKKRHKRVYYQHKQHYDKNLNEIFYSKKIGLFLYLTINLLAMSQF